MVVDEILPRPTEEQTFAEPLSFDVVVVTSLNCLNEAHDAEHTRSLVRLIKEQCMTLKGKLAMTSIVHRKLSCAAKHGFAVLSNQSIDLPTGSCSRFRTSKPDLVIYRPGHHRTFIITATGLVMMSQKSRMRREHFQQACLNAKLVPILKGDHDKLLAGQLAATMDRALLDKVLRDSGCLNWC